MRFYDKPDTPFIAAQWRYALRGLNVTEAFDAKKLVKLLLTLGQGILMLLGCLGERVSCLPSPLS